MTNSTSKMKLKWPTLTLLMTMFTSSVTGFELANTSELAKTATYFSEQFSNRFFISDYTFSIQLIPFLLLLKVAFFLGVLMKDLIAGEMKRYLEDSSSSYEFPMEFFTSPGYTSPYSYTTTRKDREEIVQPYLINSRPKLIDDSFPYLAFKTSMKFMGETAKSAANYLFGGDIFPPKSVALKNDVTTREVTSKNEDDIQEFYDEELKATNDEEHLGLNPGPPYSLNLQGFGPSGPENPTSTGQEFYTTARPTLPNENQVFNSLSVGYTSLVRPVPISYDPKSKTLYISKDVSEALNINDGDILPLPHDVLREAIHEGQIHVVGSRRKHEPIKDILHAQGVEAGRARTAQKMIKENFGLKNFKPRENFKPSIQIN